MSLEILAWLIFAVILLVVLAAIVFGLMLVRRFWLWFGPWFVDLRDGK